MKKIMILGAGIYQVPLIQQARKMGLETIVVSYAGNYPGFALADKIYEIDTTDYCGVLEAAKKEGIQGICASGTDVAVKTIGYVCDHMHLSGISEYAARTVTDKALMKAVFVRGRVSTARHCTVRSLEEARRVALEFGLPVMMKAPDTSGSRGVTKVDTLDELDMAYAEAIRVSRHNHYVVEEYIEGCEIGLDAFVSNGKLELLLPHEKYVKHCAGTTVPVGHRFPYICSEKLMGELRTQMERAIAATGMDNCAVNADIFVMPDDTVKIIETGGRAGATCIPELISIYCGFNYYEKIIENALGEPLDFTKKDAEPCIAKLIYSDKEGHISHMDMDRILGHNNARTQVKMDYSVGSKVWEMKNGTDRIGQVIMRTDDEAEVDAVIKDIKEHIVVK